MPQKLPDAEVRTRALAIQDERDRPARAAGIRIKGDPEPQDAHGALTVAKVDGKVLTLLDPASARWMGLFDRVALASAPEQRYALAMFDPKTATFSLSRPTDPARAIQAPKEWQGAVMLAWNHKR